METWIDKHSVTCHLCGGLADERETSRLTEASGELCPQCAKSIRKEIDAANENLMSYTADLTPEETIRELACRLVSTKQALWNVC